MFQNQSPQSSLSALRSCALFAGLSDENVQSLASASSVREFSTGELIFHQGDRCPGVFVVQSGLVRIHCQGPGGQQHVLHLCTPGQSFAEVAVFADFDLPASAVCVEPTVCTIIPAPFLQNLVATDHAFCRQMLAGMAYWTRHFTERLRDIVLRDASDRVVSYLRSLPHADGGFVDLPAPKKDIANHLNLTSETFSRTLRRLADDGQVELTAGRRIRLLGHD